MNIQNKACRHASRLSLTPLLLTLALFAGCSTDPIFSTIEEEVKLEDPTMRGSITSMEVIDRDGDGTKNDIYAANGMLYVRTDGTGKWNKVSLPAGAERCAEIASDGTWLYGRFTGTDHAVTHSVQRFDASAGTWKEVTGLSGVVLIGSGAGRIYAFTGANDDFDLHVTPSAGSTEFGATAIATDLATPTGTAGNYVATSAKVYSCDGAALAELTGSPAGVTGITLVPSTGNIYAVNAGYVWRYDGSAWTSAAHGLSTPTTGIAWLGGTKNLILAASGSEDGGFCEVKLGADGSLGTVISTPGDSNLSSVNTDSQDQYENSLGQWALNRIFAVTEPVPAGNEYAIYASVIHYSYDGLWSYYSNTRTEWNRE